MVWALALAFAVVNGANDGGAMVASTLRVPGQRAIVSVGVIGVALATVPLIIGTGVADTLTSGLVDAPEDALPTLIGVGVVAAVVVVGVLTRTGLPTSLTLGTVGGIVGAGIGRGLPVIGSGVGRVVLIGLAAPVVGALLALLLAQVAAAVLAARGVRGLARLGWISLVAQSVAYAANDGQKMFAVVVVAGAGVTLPAGVSIAVAFLVGSVVGVRAAARTLGGGITRGGPAEEVTAQLAGSVAVLSSAALGVPVSMTQAVSGSLVGTGLLRGRRQIRWRVAGQLGVAWVVTLPAAAIAGAAMALVLRGVT